MSISSVPRDGGYLIRSSRVVIGGHRCWGLGRAPWSLEAWNQEVERVRLAVNEARSTRSPPDAPWSHVTSHGFRKGTMSKLLAGGLDQTTASMRVLHHQGDSSWIPYVGDEPEFLRPVVRGLYV